MAVPTHRFALSQNMEDLLNGLSREGFHTMLRSEADARWTQFIAENAEAVEQEGQRLAELGYRGNVGVKMFRSARYYRGARQDADARSEVSSASEEGRRREYIATPGHLLPLMDEHVEKHCFGKEPMSPAEGWAHFQAEYSQAVRMAVQGLTGTDKLSMPDAQAKIKKAYKNRQYLKRRQRQAAAVRAAAIAAIEAEA